MIFASIMSMVDHSCYLVIANVMQSTPKFDLFLVIDFEDGDELFILQLHIRALN